MATSPLFVEGGLLASVAQVAVLAGTLVLLLTFVGLGAYAYKHLVGNGVEWPEDRDDVDTGDEGVTRGGKDDEWKYY
ncbi:MAG: hypothetical protein ABEI96_06510 [Haloarculaceae archaeon]